MAPLSAPRTSASSPLTRGDKDNLASSIAGHINGGAKDEMLPRIFAYWTSVDQNLGDAVRKLVNRGEDNAGT